MAGILIKNIAFPTDREIRLRIDEKGQVYTYGVYPTELHEAIPVPAHGRLIDADALIREHALTKFDWSDAVDVDDVKTAPTIIPADKEKTP